jgi:TolB-like protein/DNA-binding winged helix-turn-helix (wHTH) protein/Flp pilus assembly protein TadD
VPVRETHRFGDFELDRSAYELRRAGRRVRLERQPMDLLILMLQRPRELITRTEIVEHIWGRDVFIDIDSGVNTLVRKVRLALGDTSDAPRYIETVPGKGYRFIGELTAADGPAPHPAESPRREAPGNRRYRPAVVVAASIAVIVVALWAWRATRPGEVSLAVLPFASIATGPEHAHLADALHEETITALSQVDPGHFRVIGRTSMLAYKGTSKSLSEIGRELGVEYLVESSIRVENDRVRVTSRLVRARDQATIWTSPYDYEPRGMLEFQQDLAGAIAQQIRLRLSADRLDALARRHSADAEAYDLYLRGLHFWNQFTPATTERAVQHFRQAAERDPGYALAWAGLAVAFGSAPINGDAPPRAVWAQARDAASRALQAGPDLAEVQAGAGLVQFWLEWDWAAAEASFKRAVQIDPNYPVGHRLLGIALSHLGRHDEAAGPMRRVRELEPLHPMNHSLSAQVALNARNPRAALAHARHSAVIHPEFWIAHYQAAQAHEQLGEYDLALEALARAAPGVNSKILSLRGYLLARRARTAEARDVIAILEATARNKYVPPYAMALVAAGLDDRDAAVTWLERAHAVHDVHLALIPTDPKWDRLRTDPRVAALLERCGFFKPST